MEFLEFQKKHTMHVHKSPLITDVHINHCCVLHGCKYGNDDCCCVVLRHKKQKYPCEQCESSYKYRFTRFQNKLEVMMDVAYKFATLSTCHRKQVGSIISTNHFSKIVSVGYNGNYSGGENKCEGKEPSNCGCTHAELNSLVKFNSDSGNNFIMFCTLSPCKNCAKYLVNISSSISTIIYDEEYRLTDGIDLIKTIPKINLYKLSDLLAIENLTKFPHE